MEQRVSRLSEIPIRVESASTADGTMPDDPEGLGRGSQAILAELITLLERLSTQGMPGAIDLHSMPMSDIDRSRLQDDLGRGEVRVFLEAEGVSEIQETAVPGVWWIQHRNKAAELIAELIEVTSVPSILARSSDELVIGIAMLRQRMDLVPSTGPVPSHGH